MPKLDQYMLELPLNLSTWYTRFKTGSHRLPIEVGRWHNINYNQRICTVCNSAVGDEYHFLLVCPNLLTLRKTHLPPYFSKNPTPTKFIYLMNCTYKPLMFKIANYLKQGLHMFE